MAYVEWLRVKKTLIVLSIVLGALFLIAVVVRISVDGQLNSDNWVKMAGSRAQVTSKTLADGAVETTIVDPARGSSTVVTDHGWFGKRVVVTETQGEMNRDVRRPMAIGPVRVQRLDRNRVQIDTNDSIDVGMLFAYLTLFGAIIATVLAAPLARENERLEVAWTKPIDRTLYALQLYCVDLAGIVAAMVMMAVACIAAYALFQLPHLTITADGAIHAVVAIVACAAWYAMYAAITSWMKRGFGAAIGIAWPVALIVPGLALLPIGGTAVGAAFHWFFQIISYVDPLAYLHLSVGVTRHDTGLAGIGEPLKLLILAALALVYAGAGLIEWRRVEA